jgi:hypothetical protein
MASLASRVQSTIGGSDDEDDDWYEDEDHSDAPPFLDEAEMLADMHDVLNSRIADSSRTTYEGYLVRLICFLFDYRHQFQGIIMRNLLERLISAHREDKTGRTKRNKPSKRRNNTNAAIKTAIANIRRGKRYATILDRRNNYKNVGWGLARPCTALANYY